MYIYVVGIYFYVGCGVTWKKVNVIRGLILNVKVDTKNIDLRPIPRSA